MAADVYEMWLKVSSANRPLNHYELLGLPLFTAEPPVIAEAVEGAIRKVRFHLIGAHAGEARRLLEELEQAKKTLLNATTRRDYETFLRQGGSASPPPVAPPIPSAAPQAAVIPAAMPTAANVPPMAASILAAVPTAPMAAPPYIPAAAPMMATAVPTAPMAMPYGAPSVPMATPMQAAPYGTVPMAQGAPTMAMPVNAGFNPNSSAATNVSYRRRKKAQQKLVMQLVGGSVAALVVLGLYVLFTRNPPQQTVVSKGTSSLVAPPTDEFARPDLSRLNPVKTTAPVEPTVSRPRVQPSQMDSMRAGMSKVMTDDSPPPRRMPDPPKTEMPAETTKTPAKTITPEPKPAAPPPAKVMTKADAKELAEINKSMTAARTALAGNKIKVAETAIDEALFSATADDSTATVERMKALMAANQKFWEAALAGAKALQADEQLKDGDTVVGSVTSVDDKKVMLKIEDKPQAVLFDSPEKAPRNVLILLVEKSLGKGSPEASLAIGGHLLVHPRPDREQVRTILAAAGSAADPLLAELDAMKN